MIGQNAANNGPSRTAALAKAISQLKRLHVPFPDGHAQHVQLPILVLAGCASTLKMLTEQSAWMSASKYLEHSLLTVVIRKPI